MSDINIIKVPLKQTKHIGGSNSKQKIIIHHPEYYGSVTQLNNMMISMGYSMMGYNYYIRKDGSIYEGRPLTCVSANCFGQNSCSIGVSCEGNYDKDTEMPQAQFNSLVKLCVYLSNKYGISKDADHINGHKHFKNTDCPGRYFPLQRALSAIYSGGNVNASASSNSSEVPRTQFEKAKIYNSNKDIKDIQQKLIKAGYSLPKYGADGGFGQETFNAILALQKANGLSADGMVGPDTLHILDIKAGIDHSLSSDVIKYFQTALINAGYSLPKYGADGMLGGETIDTAHKVILKKSGSKSELNTALQKILISRGYSMGRYGADGYYGETTFNAVTNFQKNHGLNADGIVGPNTWDKLLK